MISSMDDQEQRRIEPINWDVMDGWDESPRSSTFVSNNLLQENINGIEQIEEIFSDMNDNDTDKQSEQIFFNTPTVPDDDQIFENRNESNDNILVDDQQMNAFDYCLRFLEKLTVAVNTSESTLVNLVIPAKTGDSYLNNLQMSLPTDVDVTAQDPLKKLSDLLQTGIFTLPSFRRICSTDSTNHTDPIGEQTNENPDGTTAAPTERNGNHMNQDIQRTTQSDLPTSPIPKHTCLSDLSLSLSRLLSNAKTIVQELQLVRLEIFEQPQLFWKRRSINCLKNKWCPAIQGQSGKQRHYIGIKWSRLTDCDPNNLFILVQVLSYDGQPHLSKILVPPKTKVKQPKPSGLRKSKVKIRPKLDDLIVKDTNGFNKTHKALLCPITEKEYRQRTKSLQVIMFSLYKTSEEIVNSNHAHDSINNEDDEEEEEEQEQADISIEDEVLKLCKLRICLCQRTDQNDLQCVSNFIDTELIEESKGNKSLAIDANEITPRCLCNCGNEIITLPLNTDSEKCGFVVSLNDVLLDHSQIRGPKDKKLSFKSIPNSTHGQNCLHVMVSKKSALETIKQNSNPYEGLFQKLLLDVIFNYVEHSDNPHDHKSTDAEIFNQSNEISQTESLIW